MKGNSQRVWLSRILAINWRGFRQIIDLEEDTVIAGAFGTGKTALLDLIQYVLVGGSHASFNRAARGRASGRTIVSYCLCDTNTERDGQPHYTRQSGVTLVALEFTWPGKGEPRRETWGARIEFASPTSEPKVTWFFVPDRLEWSSLAPGGQQMLEEEAFRTLVRRDFDGAVFGRAMDYLEEMATPRHLHFDRVQMNKTMPKAIAFEPEENFERFIREFLLEPNPVDVREVRQSLGAHREMQARLAKLHDEASHLQGLSKKHQGYVAAMRDAALFGHAKFVLAREEVAEKLQRLEDKLARLKEQHASELDDLDRAVSELEQVTKLIAEVRLEASRDPDHVKLDDWERKKKELHAQIQSLREARQAVSQRLADRAHQWSSWLKRGTGFRLEGLPAELAVDDSWLKALRAGAETKALEALPALAQRFQEIFQKTGELLQPSREDLKAAERKLQDLARELEAIDRKETPGAFPLFAALKQKLSGGFHRAPEQLCRLVEVRPDEERWWPALELMLGRNRFAVVVADEDYPAALDILKRLPPGREGESLVNPREARSLERQPKENSLATKVDVADATAHAFVHHLLGDVLCVETVEELDHCEAGRAITPDGIFKQVPTRRRLREDAERPFTLGREGLERMKRERLREQLETRARRDALDQQIKDVLAWLDWGKQASLGDPRLPDRSNELARLPELEKEWGVAVETAKLLATPEREARMRKLRELDAQKQNLDRKIGSLSDATQKFNQQAKELQEQLASAKEQLDQAKLAVTENRVRMSPGLLDADVEAFLQPLLVGKESWRERMEAAQTKSTELAAQAATLRYERNDLRRALAETRDEKGAYRHPEYRFDIDNEDESNDRWDTRLQLLLTHELERHQALAAEKKREWEERLKAQVLDKLNERLREAELTVRQLRQYLDRDVGKYRYRITHRRDPALNAVWHLLDTGFEPTDELMQAVKTEEIERAKEELMRAVEAADAPQPEERALRLLDYRCYHRYDVVMEPVGAPNAAVISLNRSIVKMSGGENQAPFFICMLAAFHRVYDVGSQRFRQNLGLVVMDEAFSKLSGDGIEDCLELARNFNLQLLMAVPIDRLGVMHPYADTTILCRKCEQRGPDGYVSHIDNVPTRLTPEQVREAVE